MNSQSRALARNAAGQPTSRCSRSMLLPSFNIRGADPKIWFAAFEYILANNGVASEADKFAQLLQHLEGPELHHMYNIIRSEAGDKYTLAKKRLIREYKQFKKEYERQERAKTREAIYVISFVILMLIIMILVNLSLIHI